LFDFSSYVAAMEKALKNFEYSSDWPDLINALTKLNKVSWLITSFYLSYWISQKPNRLSISDFI